MSRVALRLLGKFEAACAGRPVTLKSKKAQALVAYLALAPGRRHARDRLAALLWGDMRDERARHNLRQCTSSLRKALTEDVLVGEGEALYLCPEAIEVDVALLEHPDPRRATEAYRGELLEGFSLREEPFAEWLAFERRRLRERASERFGELTERLVGDGELEEAIEVSRRRLAIEPTSERAHQQAMRLYERTGDRSAALAQYEACVEILRGQLGIAPGAETERLRAQLSHPVDARSFASPTATETHGSEFPELPDRPSLVVLPFEVVGAEEYFGNGIAEDISVALSKFGSLFVVSALAGRHWRGRELDPREVGRELGVRYVVLGSVRRADERMRITVQLTDALDGKQVWAQSYDGSFKDIFDIQHEVIERIVATVASRVESASLLRARRKPTTVLAAYDCLLRGVDHHHRWTRDDNASAIAMFERAIELDPNYALSYAWLACALGQRNYFQSDPSWLVHAMRLVEKAHALDDGECECYRMFAAYYLTRRDFDKAEHNQARALELNPNDDRIVCQQGELENCLGRPEEAERWVRRAMRLNPYHPDSYSAHLARALFHGGRFDEALAALRRMGQHTARDYAFMAACAQRDGRGAEAEEHLSELRRLAPDFSVDRLVASLPYKHREPLDDIADALRAVGLAAAE